MFRLHRIGLVVTCLAVATVSMAIGATARAAGGLDGPRVPGARTQAGALTPGYLLRLPVPEGQSPWCAVSTLSDSPVVGAVGSTDGTGGWEVGADGSVFACGAAGYYGSLPGLGLHAARPVVGMAATPDDRGYWLVAADGAVFAFGDARYLGGANTERLNSPIVGMVADGGGDGYWLVAADGGVFAYGQAAFEGSMGGQRLNAPIVGIASAGGQAYWLVAADGGVFAFGGAPFYGSAASIGLAAPASGITAAPGGRGYWIVARDGGVFAYGSAPFDPQVQPMFGTPVGVTPVNPVIALYPRNGGSTYSLVSASPAVEPGVAGHTGYDLARQEFALDPTASGADATLFDLGQALEYLLLDGTGNGASPGAVATCVADLEGLQIYVYSMNQGSGTGTEYETAVAQTKQIAAFLQLSAAPYLAYLYP
jgi:hypothetical protein